MSFASSSRFTKFAISALVLGFSISAAAALPFEDIIRKAAIDSGLTRPEATYADVDMALFEPGKTLFKSRSLSLNGDISCQQCHLDQFGSADGIPNAVAVGGDGKGAARVMGAGGILPRNTLPFWGRGGKGFDTFFWDGKVDFLAGAKISQFGDAPPSNDPMIVADHLPVVEIREMLSETGVVKDNKSEAVAAAETLYRELARKLHRDEAAATEQIATAFGIGPDQVEYIHYATALTTFIRTNFRLKETKFHRFVFDGAELSTDELDGARLFYGKGKCSTCHSGTYFTDFRFHAVPFPQIGFGKNGFGVDYGRFNVTQDPEDLYKFRTPPLWNVLKTSPYGHSGSVATVEEAIRVHFDPLSSVDPKEMSALDRHEFFKRLETAAGERLLMGYLDDREISELASFLKTLEFDGDPAGDPE
ncbi:His-Xaa-Ser system-associated MauG-like protein [Dongia sp.]|uniref:His-Xaa-Ser system-associated MauG-like protein n=1 Tax=Dongia sp. TaxID=1977262 RepID=UPI0035B41461